MTRTSTSRRADRVRVLRLGTTLLLLTGCSRTADARAGTVDSGATKTGAAAPVPVFVAESTTVNAPLLLPSQLYVEQDALVGARSAALLQSLTVDLGSSVTAGQVIGQQENEAQRLAVSRGEVTLESAKKTAGRARELRGANGIAASELEDAEFRVRIAEVALREAEHALEQSRVIAPFSGVVTGRYAQPGQLLALHDSVVRVAARGPHLARARVPEASAAVLRVGASASVLSGARDRAGARIIRLSPAVDAASGTREIIVRVDDRAALLTGSAVSVELPQASRRALTIPRTALGDGGYVIVMDGSRAVVRSVIAGATEGDRVEILAGLAAGERIRRNAR